MRRILSLFIFGIICSGVQGQQLDLGDYIYPIRNVEGLYSANFGEMRPGHFHAGIDIKTDGAEGKPLVAVADGYISRVHISAHGYGRAIYITLSNGTTAVYGHLQRFRDDIEKQVREERYSRRANSFDLWFGPETWPVKQGDVVGFSGNSGSSFGPHLHYELRDTKTQRLRNIVREGIIRPEDDLLPRIMRLHYIEVDTLQGVPMHGVLESYAVVRKVEGDYSLTRETPIPVGRKGYFVVETSDRRNGVHNTFGVWRVSLAADGEQLFEYRMDGFTHDLSRCCDAVSYYPLQLTSRNEVIRLAQLAQAPDCFYPVMRERGLVRTATGQTRRMRIEAEDDCGNVSHLEFTVTGREETFFAQADSAAVILQPGKAAVVRLGSEATARIPAGAVYEPLFCRIEHREAPVSDSTLLILSPAYRILDVTTPLRKAVTLSVRAFIPEKLQQRTAFAARNAKGNVTYVGGKYANGAMTATTRTTGELFIVADTIPPRIRPLFAEGADLTRADRLRFGVGDNFSGVSTYMLFIDGAWVPCDRYPVQGTFVHTFDVPAARKKHSVQLVVTDACGNTARWEGNFYR
ncbi:peptidoglycan DD-metalloendopeptidase family protein [uncultured Alistipes sp.]|uniref:M23 family metallopeptidase n=1 Tax=uncultured Alistipes sp. TaxID=538949 RepID=UPI0027D9418D|nr:peptidoglycan DD-metalloendopeptidase family protein [uncultured Alistipes sp.]